MVRHRITAPLLLACALLLVGSTAHAQYTYSKSKEGSASQGTTQRQAGKQESAAEQQVSGQVQRTKNVEVRTLDPKGKAQQNRVVLLQTDQGRRIVVDLGPAQALQGVSLQQGAQLDASGQWIRIGDRPVLWANQVTVDGKSMQIKRPQQEQSRQITGQILRSKQVDIKGTDFTNQVVLLQTDQGRQLVADLGPMTNLRGLRLQPGAEIEVRGRPGRVGDQLVLMADQVSAGGKTVSIHRERQQAAYRPQQQAAQQRTWSAQQASKRSGQQQTPSHMNITSARRLIGRSVQDNQGNGVGEVTHLMIHGVTGDVRVLLIGSKQGSQMEQGSQTGQDLIPVPWEAVSLQEQTLTVNATPEALKQVPRVNLSYVAKLTQPRVVTQIQSYYLTPEESPQERGTRQPSQGPQGQHQQSPQDQGRGAQQQYRTDPRASDQEGTGGASSGRKQQGWQARQRGGQANEPHILIGRGIVTTLFPPMYASATEVRGTEIESADGQFVGEVDRIMIDTDHGHVAYMLIARGGLLGGAEEWIPVPFDALQ
jgi:sporulation protein YlmC with PRC-barrel domain/nitrate reductase NapAB chaperone NapD